MTVTLKTAVLLPPNRGIHQTVRLEIILCSLSGMFFNASFPDSCRTCNVDSSAWRTSLFRNSLCSCSYIGIRHSSETFKIYLAAQRDALAVHLLLLAVQWRPPDEFLRHEACNSLGGSKSAGNDDLFTMHLDNRRFAALICFFTTLPWA